MLTEKIARWEELKIEISKLEAEIKKEVCTLGKTQQVGNVKASFSKGRKTYNYEGIAKSVDASDELITLHTQQKTVTDWTKLVKELSPSEEVMNQFVKVGASSVSLKIIS